MLLGILAAQETGPALLTFAEQRRSAPNVRRPWSRSDASRIRPWQSALRAVGAPRSPPRRSLGQARRLARPARRRPAGGAARPRRACASSRHLGSSASGGALAATGPAGPAAQWRQPGVAGRCVVGGASQLDMGAARPFLAWPSSGRPAGLAALVALREIQVLSRLPSRGGRRGRLLRPGGFRRRGPRFVELPLLASARRLLRGLGRPGCPEFPRGATHRIETGTTVAYLERLRHAWGANQPPGKAATLAALESVPRGPADGAARPGAVPRGSRSDWRAGLAPAPNALTNAGTGHGARHCYV